MTNIVLASNNKHKIKEFNEMLNNVEILTLNDIEFFESFEKAQEKYEFLDINKLKNFC